MTEATSSAAVAVPGETRRYAAFISYCHADSKSAVALQRFLETYRLPRDVAGAEADRATLQARLRPVFLDRADMPAGTDLRGEIDAALIASTALIVVCSPAAAKSRWVNLEIERFRQHHGDSRIFAVIIDGVAHASEHAAGAERECFPPALRLRDTSEGPVRADPAAVDLRRSGDGQQVGRLRLVAGLVGVPLDQLVHRDARRRHRRNLALIIGLSLGLAATSSLALYAIAARNEAQRQRFAAEGMIEFMIGDLRKTLEPMGRLSAMDPLGKKALDYYRQQDAEALDGDSLGRRARVLLLVGEIQDQRGNLDLALSNFQAAAGTTRELLDRKPNDPKRIFDHAQSVYWVGYIAYRRGNFAAAEPAFQEYRRLADQLVRIDPKSDEYFAEKGYAYGNLGTLLFVMGNNRDAEAALRTSLNVAEQVAKRDPGGVSEKLDLATSHAWVADSLERQGKFAAAVVERKVEMGILEKVLAADPANTLARAAHSNSLRSQARIALASGNQVAAIPLAVAAAREAAVVANADTSNAEAAARAALAQVTLGEAFIANNDLSGAANAAGAARRFASVLPARDRSVASWQSTEARELLLRSSIALASRRPADAMSFAMLAQQQLATMQGGNTSDRRYLQASATMRAAQAGLATGKVTEAQAMLRELVAAGLATTANLEPRMLTMQLTAAQELGDLSAAAQITAKLDSLRETRRNSG